MIEETLEFLWKNDETVKTVFEEHKKKNSTLNFLPEEIIDRILKIYFFEKEKISEKISGDNPALQELKNTVKKYSIKEDFKNLLEKNQNFILKILILTDNENFCDNGRWNESILNLACRYGNLEITKFLVKHRNIKRFPMIFPSILIQGEFFSFEFLHWAIENKLCDITKRCVRDAWYKKLNNDVLIYMLKHTKPDYNDEKSFRELSMKDQINLLLEEIAGEFFGDYDD